MSRSIRETIDGVRKRRHTIIAEKALGRALRSGEEIHHLNENDEDDTPENLVICPNRSYHALLHVRTRALNACGNPNHRKCKYCGNWDDTGNMTNKGKTTVAGDWVHKACNTLFEKARRLRKIYSAT